jgi:hypothetical protein
VRGWKRKVVLVHKGNIYFNYIAYFVYAANAYILLPSFTGNVSKKVFLTITFCATIFASWYPPAGTTDHLQDPPAGTCRNSQGRTPSTGTPAGMFKSPAATLISTFSSDSVRLTAKKLG